MTREMYYKLTQPFREPKRARSLHIANKILTAILFVAYPILLIRIYFCQSEYLLGSILVPLDGFIGVTVFRYLVNRRRPYETFGLPPVVFSAAIIAFTFFYVPGMTAIGIVLLVCTILLSVIRVVSGVHYISDVLAALLIAAGLASVYWFL